MKISIRVVTENTELRKGNEAGNIHRDIAQVGKTISNIQNK